MQDIDFSLVGARMKQLRNKQGITQEQVAKDLGCTVGFVSNVENDRAKLNLKVLSYYSKMCNVSIDTLLSSGTDPDSSDQKAAILDEEIIRIFRTFTYEEREKIIKMLQLWQSDKID